MKLSSWFIQSNVITCSLKNEQQPESFHQKCFALKRYNLLIQVLWHDIKKPKKNIEKERNKKLKKEKHKKVKQCSRCTLRPDTIFGSWKPLMMKYTFYFSSKALFVLKIFKLSSSRFGHVEKRLDQKDKVSFKFHDVTAWLTDNCNTHIAQYLDK